MEGVVELINELQETRDVRRRLLPTVAKLQGYGYDFVSYLPLLVLALSVVGAFALIARFITSWEFLFKHLAPNMFLRDLVQQFVKVAVFLLGVLLALDLLDATRAVGTLLGAAGLISLAISFALRDSVENYITSILLSLRQPFAPDDHVLIEGFEGRIARLTSRATILLTFDGDTVRIPNATVFKATIVNYSRNPLRRFSFTVGVAPNTALLEAQQVALDTLRVMVGVLDEPSPVCLVDSLGNYTIDLFVAGWIDQQQADFLKVKSEAIRLVTQAFAAAGIDVPDPTYNVRVLRRPAAAVEPVVHAEQPGNVAIDISRDDTLARQVEEDRQYAKSSNLLDPAAPRWAGSTRSCRQPSS
ncbi:MAG: mechanosensitive ion channel family protein [Candidatus Competibacteraceae bacterium]|nr:mechanosensitive ion channel family protein [Candidatus Competibacteraceae bacterium]